MEITYDHEACFAYVKDGAGRVVASECVIVREAGGWAEAREQAIRGVRAKAAEALSFGPPPPDETLPYPGSPQLVSIEPADETADAAPLGGDSA
jgi:hypothetical protein